MSIARSMRAVGKASHGTLVGTRAGICDQNATRDVTAELQRSGMMLQVQQDSIAPCLMKSDGTFLFLGMNTWETFGPLDFFYRFEWGFTNEPQKISQGPKVYHTKI